MSRSDGFAVADVSTSFVDDDKVRRLWRILAQQAACEAGWVYLTVLLGSWREGRRLSAEEAMPVGFVIDPLVIDALRKVKLLDRTARVPSGAWSGWYGAAHARREQAREAGRIGNARRWGSGPDTRPNGPPIAPRSPNRPRPNGPPIAEGSRPDRDPTSRPDRVRDPRPTVPSGPSYRRARARGDGSQATETPKRIGDLLAGSSFLEEHNRRSET